MTDFDPIRAQRNALAMLMVEHDIVKQRMRSAARQLAEAQAHFDAVALIERFASDRKDEARAKLCALRKEEDAQPARPECQ